MSCALPVLMSPICKDGKCYIDGGVTCNYPLKNCIDSNKNIEEILGFKNQYEEHNKSQIDSNSTLLDFVTNFLFKLIHSISSNNTIQSSITYEVISNTDFISISTLKSALYSTEIREQLYLSGIETATKFLSNLENSV